jgi:hypothetical protein
LRNSAASVPGLLLLGYLSDKIRLRLVISLSCFGAALSCILLWGFATNTGVLIAFVIMFGLLGLSYSVLWTKLITVIASASCRAALMPSVAYESEADACLPRRLAEDDPSLPPLLFPIFAFSRGIGNVSSGKSGRCNCIASVLSNRDSTSCRSSLDRAAQIRLDAGFCRRIRRGTLCESSRPQTMLFRQLTRF